jgi:hypothetical protein
VVIRPTNFTPRCKAGLGIKLKELSAGLRVKEMADGQCSRGGIEVGDVLVGFNGADLKEVLRNDLSDNSILRAINSFGENSYTLNFNTLPPKSSTAQTAIVRMTILSGFPPQKGTRTTNPYGRQFSRGSYLCPANQTNNSQNCYWGLNFYMHLIQ